jgi:hypothetical protein
MEYAGNRLRHALEERLVRAHEIIGAARGPLDKLTFAANIDGIRGIRAMYPPFGAQVHDVRSRFPPANVDADQRRGHGGCRQVRGLVSQRKMQVGTQPAPYFLS